MNYANTFASRQVVAVTVKLATGRINERSLSIIIMAAMVLPFGLTLIGCPVVNEPPAIVNLQRFDYVFRVVDLSNSPDTSKELGFAGFEDQINTNIEDLQRLATIFTTSMPTTDRRSAPDSTLAHLAQVALIEYTNTEVNDIVNNLKSKNVYVQFSHRDFLINQTADQASHGGVVHSTTSVDKRVLTFDGRSISPQGWIFGYGEFKLLETEEPSLVYLPVAEGNEDIVIEFMQYLGNDLLTFPDAEITNQGNGLTMITIGEMTTVIEEEVTFARSWWKRIVRIVLSVTGLVTAAVGSILNMTGVGAPVGSVLFWVGLIIETSSVFI